MFTQQYLMLLSLTTLHQVLQSNTRTELTLTNVNEKLCNFPINSVIALNERELE